MRTIVSLYGSGKRRLRDIGVTLVKGIPPSEKEGAMTPIIPPALRQAIKRGRLTPSQLTCLIRVEAKALGLSPADAIKRARARNLPRHYLADDLALLVQLQN